MCPFTAGWRIGKYSINRRVKSPPGWCLTEALLLDDASLRSPEAPSPPFAADGATSWYVMGGKRQAALTSNMLIWEWSGCTFDGGWYLFVGCLNDQLLLNRMLIFSDCREQPVLDYMATTHRLASAIILAFLSLTEVISCIPSSGTWVWEARPKRPGCPRFAAHQGIWRTKSVLTCHVPNNSLK